MDISIHADKLAVRTVYNDRYNLVQFFRGIKSDFLDYNCPVDTLAAGLQRKNEADLWHVDITLALCTDESAPFSVNGECIGSNHGHPCGVVVECENHQKSFCDIGSLWQDADGIKWTLLRILSPDRLLFVSENLGPTKTEYSFLNSISKTLQFVSDGVNTDPIEISSQSGGHQLYKAVADRKRKLYYLKEGKRFEITGYHTECDGAEIHEEYNVINPATVAEAIRKGRPVGGYIENPDLAVGEAMLHYNMIYRIQSDGTVICDFEHRRLCDIKWNRCFGVMYQSRCDVASGGIWRFIPKTKPFCADGHTFDFSAPFDATAEPYPASFSITRDYFSDKNSPPDRQTDIIRYADGTTVSAFCCGFLPIFDGAPEKRSQNLDTAVFIKNTRKFYPYIINGKNSVDSIRAVAYKKYFPDADRNSSFYSVEFDGVTYLYFDFYSENTLSKTVPLPYNAELSLLEKSEDICFNHCESTLTVSGKRGYAVFKY